MKLLLEVCYLVWKSFGRMPTEGDPPHAVARENAKTGQNLANSQLRVNPDVVCS
ncbi:MAG: hypothetical protein NTX48_01545 [Planctomycetales bacterium]|nr:hypothetical protein [Planctomycetales bacterium]